MFLVDSHNLRILFFVTVELYLFAVVPHFCKNTTNVLLLCFRNGTALSFDMIIFRAEVRYNFVFDTMKIGGAYVIENLRYSPGVNLSTVVVEESARLIVRYYGLIDGSVGLTRYIDKHFVGGMTHTVGCLIAVCADTMGVVVRQLLIGA